MLLRKRSVRGKTMTDDDFWYERVELVDPDVLDEIRSRRLTWTAHVPPGICSNKSLRCAKCGARFAAIHDIEVHLIVERMNCGFRVPCIVPAETELEDWLEEPDFWEWWIEVAQTIYPAGG